MTPLPIAQHNQTGLTALTKLRALGRKLWNRATERPYRDKAAYMAWLAKHEVSFEDFANARAPELLDEAVRYEEWLYAYATLEREKVPINLGGNAYARLVYFLARWQRPNTIVETGVASGYSSRAFLDAMAANGGTGTLHSSDLPYMNEKDAYLHIGHLVEPALKKNWRLHIDGDRVSLPKIVKDVLSIDLFHYDSDKSKAGRDFALDTVRAKLRKGATLIFDDINDNDWFEKIVYRLMDPVLGRPAGQSFHVLKTRHKHVGVIFL